MVKKEYIPDRGDYVWLNFTPQTGYEQKGKRPAIVISPKEYNKKVGLALFCPITSIKKDYPFEVNINNSKIKGVVLSDQMKSLDWQYRNAEFISKSAKEELDEVIEKLTLLIL